MARRSVPKRLAAPDPFARSRMPRGDLAGRGRVRVQAEGPDLRGSMKLYDGQMANVPSSGAKSTITKPDVPSWVDQSSVRLTQ